MIRLTANFSINSDISKRMRDSGELNISCARRLTSSVFPTPVEPTKMKETGLRLEAMPTRPRRMALATSWTASSWPMIWVLSRSSRWARRSYSCSWIWLAGILVHSSMTRARFSTVRAGVHWSARPSFSALSWSSWLFSTASLW